MSTYGSWFPGWHWGWLAATFLLLAAPLASRRRLAYAAFWGFVLAIAVAFFGFRDRNSVQHWGISFARYAPTLGERRSLSFWSSGGEVGIGYRYIGFTQNLSRNDWKPGLSISWARNPDQSEKSPAWRDLWFNAGGFQMAWFNEERPDVGQTLRWRGIVVPNWFAILIFAIPIVLYARQFQHSRKIARRLATDCCGKCGYDLRTQHPGAKCPECGTPKPASPAASKLSTATETQGNQK